jgi:hypothetical protein
MNLDLEDTRRKLIAMRAKLGADTPAGHRCSNLVEQLENMRTAASKEQRGHLSKGIQRQMAELTDLAAKADKPQ